MSYAKRATVAVGLAMGGLLLGGPASRVAVAEPVVAAEARELAREAYVYGFPLVDSYRILHAYAVDAASPEYKAPWNRIASIGRVFTPADTTVQTPNSDTPYSMVAFDLRAEPLVLTVPPIEKERYFSIQFIDAYTFNFDYVGSRTTGNGGGRYLLAGPGWKGNAPAGIAKVVRSETEIGLAIYRTQLLEPSDIENVRKVQAEYKVEPLSAFLGTGAPPAPPALEFVAPLTPETQKTSLRFFEVLDFVLRRCPVDPTETELRARFAKAGIGGGSPFRADALSPEAKQAFGEGMAAAWKDLAEVEAAIAGGKVSSGDLFGTRQHLKNNYAYRFAAAVLGIYGNSEAEAMYPAYRADSAGAPLDGAKHRYVLRFAADEFPPVHAFWSATLYQLPASLLYANPIDRYLVNSPMLPKLRRDADGGVTIHVQHESPGKDLESNWLPAPAGPFWIALRLYWPRPEALDRTWKAPPLRRVE